MITGKLRSFTTGKANSLPRQGAAPESAAWQTAAPQAETTTLGSIKGGIAPVDDGAVGRVLPEKPAVRLRRLAGVATWALVLVLAGVATAIVGLFQVFGDSPAWFTPAFISCGVIGMILTMMAFATLRFRGVPWMFMAASTITLFAAFVMLRIA
ncbi:hypothetical protein [Glycomyces rhizosphaerae]|uniref:Uncharacterized protein n=1 Tax=Glycomyces rhizosphaerae TaxID=2054422 RepID=A0ABV7Q549_9ACTN